jgi:signal transduction histidine kinase
MPTDAREDLDRQRDALLHSLSHDLRTPVAAIKAAIGVVLANEPPGTSPALHRLLGNIDLAADELTRLIDDRLELARLQAGRVELYRTAVDLRDLIGRTTRSLEPLIQARGQHLELCLPCHPIVAQVDVQSWSRVVRNLVESASLDGGHINLTLTATESEIDLCVASDGPAPATGLELSIARGLVELHGGTLTLDAEPGQGSMFRVRQPR